MTNKWIKNRFVLSVQTVKIWLNPKLEVYLQPQAKAMTVLSNNMTETRKGILNMEILQIYCLILYSYGRT